MSNEDFESFLTLEQAIRANSKLFLGLELEHIQDNKWILLKMMQHLVLHIVMLECTPLVVEILDDVYIISSKKNWFIKGGLKDVDPKKFFLTMDPIPNFKEFVIRPEPVLYTFAKNILIINSGTLTEIKGGFDKSTLDKIIIRYPDSFLVGFEGVLL